MQMIEDLQRAIEEISQRKARPNVLIVSPAIYEQMIYIERTVTVWELPGYMRRRGPDGKTWIEKVRRCVYRGKGNRARRRMGLLPLATDWDDGWNEE